MPNQRIGEPWAGATYNGFSGPTTGATTNTATTHRRREKMSRNTLLGGLGAAVAAGLLFGLWARPEFGEDGRAREPMKAAPSTVEAPAAQVPIEVNAPIVTPPPQVDG